MKYALILACVLSFCVGTAQHKVVFDGQVSAIGSYSFDQHLSGFVGGRYIPELTYRYHMDTLKSLTVFASANLSGSALFHPFDSANTSGALNPYRVWGRYATKAFEIRVGLQKIDFGSATLVRPLQWFNQIDPRDPLQLTNGVYGALGRYYFKNNANIWVWTLIGNNKARGFDALPSTKHTPEMGGRVQWSVSKGEMAISYHYRKVDNQLIPNAPKELKEHRMGLDGKFDAIIGCWYETSYTYKERPISNLTHQAMVNVGADYTVPIGSGLTVVTEHLVASYDQDAFAFQNPAHITVFMGTYPVTFFDNLSAMCYWNWELSNYTLFLNYQHSFKKWQGYIMPYYNPATSTGGLLRNDLVNNFSGPGIRLMAVYNH